MIKKVLFVQVNPDMVSSLEDAGLSFTGKDETGQRMEVWGSPFSNCSRINSSLQLF